MLFHIAGVVGEVPIDKLIAAALTLARSKMAASRLSDAPPP